MDAFTTALTLLSRRELSVAELRRRLTTRQFAPDEIDATVARLLADRTLDDRRVARASARHEASIRHRGRRRALQRLGQQGIAADTAREAVDEVFAELDEGALLERAITRRLRGATARSLDQAGRARIVRALGAQGFTIGAVLAQLRRMGQDESGE